MSADVSADTRSTYRPRVSTDTRSTDALSTHDPRERKLRRWEKTARQDHHVRIAQPSKNLNRYLVDKFHLSTAKAKSALLELIDRSVYKLSTKYLAFSTLESRLLLWIAASLVAKTRNELQ